jgi:hypothetical protein
MKDWEILPKEDDIFLNLMSHVLNSFRNQLVGETTLSVK